MRRWSLLVLGLSGLAAGLGLWALAGADAAPGTEAASLRAPTLQQASTPDMQLSPAVGERARPLLELGEFVIAPDSPPAALGSPAAAAVGAEAWLSVQDAEGRPLPDAQVFHVKAGEPTSAESLSALMRRGAGEPPLPRPESRQGRTDAAGRFVTVSPGLQLLVCRAGLLPARVTAPPSGERVVRLEPAAGLEILVDAPDGVPPEELRVVVSGGPRLLGVDAELLRRTVAHVGGTPWLDQRRRPGGRVELVFAPLGVAPVPGLEPPLHGADPQGVVSLLGVLPDRRLTIELRDRWQQTLDRREALVLNAGETRQVSLGVSGAPRALDVIVRSADGSPLPDARVWLRLADGDGTFGGLTDAAGHHVFEGLFAKRVSLEVNEPGWLPYRADAVRVASGRVEIVLGQGRALDVLLVDARHGDVLPAEALRASWSVNGVEVSDRPASTSCGVDGRACRIDGVPDGELQLRAVLGGRLYETVHDTRQGELRWELPCHGDVTLGFDAVVADGSLLSVQFEELDPAGAVLHRFERQLRHDAERGDLPLGPVREGRYRVGLAVFAGGGFVPLGEPRELLVAAHAAQVVRVRD